jgi:alcohol dehydrogenase
LTARFGTVHGHAVGLMLPHVLRFNAEDPTARAAYGELMEYAGLRVETSSDGQRVDAFAARIEALLQTAFPTPHAAICVPHSAIPDLAQEAAAQWTAQFNPRPVSAADFAALYHSALACHP